MPDREKVIKWLDVCKTADRAVGLKEDYPCRECPYKDSSRCMRELVADALALLKEQEEREKAICKEICDFIRGACSTDTDDDKDFVCYEIQRCFTHFGRSVK